MNAYDVNIIVAGNPVLRIISSHVPLCLYKLWENSSCFRTKCKRVNTLDVDVLDRFGEELIVMHFDSQLPGEIVFHARCRLNHPYLLAPKTLLHHRGHLGQLPLFLRR